MWHLIANLDDYSRYLLYANIVQRETRWTHIVSLEAVWLAHGIPLSYYVDNHSIFRFVEKRDSIWKKHHLKTDEAETQWKRIMNECRVKVTYALSPQAKGKIERPYRWLQDRVVRICTREGVATVDRVRKVLSDEVSRYNERQVHSTTGEIPRIWFERAIKEEKHLFRPFKVPYPLQSTKDVFCIKEERTTNAYRRISIKGIELKVSGADPYQKTELRMVSDERTNLTEIRFWHNDILADIQKIKTADFRSLNC